MLTGSPAGARHNPWHPRREGGRRCWFEAMEPRYLLAADPLFVGATFVEEDMGSDLHGDTFEVTFVGGEPGTQLTRVEIQTDQSPAGFGVGDSFFDTEPGGLGADEAYGFSVIMLRTRDPNATVRALVEDGSTLLVLELSGFQAGDRLVFHIDVDEVEEWDPAETDLRRINEGFDPINSGIEFQGSKLSAFFTAPHYYDAQSTAEFRNFYDENLRDTGLELPEDNAGGKRDRSAGAIGQAQQLPLPVSLAGRVYLETDLDLVPDPGEPGLPGVSLALWRQVDGGYQFTGHTTLTDAQGNYRFGAELKLPPGIYQVRETQPAGLFSVGAIPGTVEGQPSGRSAAGDRDVLTDIEIPLGDQHAVDYLFAEALPATLSGFVYHDRDNDGRREAGEEGIAGARLRIIPVETIVAQATVQVLTDARGYYQADGLAPGTYRIVELETPAGYLDGLDAAGTVAGVTRGAAVNPGDSIEAIFVGGGEAGIEYNFGELVPATIRGHVRLADADGDCYVQGSVDRPLAGVTVRLRDAQGQLITETKTDASGAYRFTGLRPGRYGVTEITPEDLINGQTHVGTVNGIQVGVVAADDQIVDIVVGSAQQAVDYDFCEYVPATLSGTVYHDRDNDGRRESGEEGLAQVRVTLLDSGGNQVATTLTDSLGRYRFERLPAGIYAIVETQPAGWVDGLDQAGTVDGRKAGRAVNPGDRIEDIRLRWGETGIDYDFGEFRYAQIEGSVHLTTPRGDCDAEQNDLRPLAGAVVYLQDARGTRLAQTVTDATGGYRFERLLPGSYTIVEVTPAGLYDGADHVGQVDGRTVGRLSGNDTIADIVLSSGQAAVDYDFCEQEPASLSGYVYHDRNNNGRREAGEEPLAGVRLTLRDATGQTVAQAPTNASGYYEFLALPSGTYAVVQTQPAGYLDGLDAAGTIGGMTSGTAVNPGDEIREIPLLWGDAGIDYNFGELRPGSIAGYVYADRDVDCQFDPDERPLSGVTIELRNEAGRVVAQTQTDERGAYRFEGLAPGRYTLYEHQPPGYFQGGQRAGSGGGDASLEDLIREIAIGSGQRLIDYNFCEIPPASLSGRVFLDLDGDCRFDPDESPLSGVTIELRNNQGQSIATTQTDAQGRYEFVSLRPGTYAVRETQPAGLLQGGQRAGSGGGDVSEPDVISQIVVRPEARLVDYDFCEVPPASLEGVVYVDLQRNSRLDAGEPRLEGVTLRLLDREGREMATTRTDAQGRYRFEDLRPGQYAVRQQQPGAYFQGGQQAGAQGGRTDVDNLISAIPIAAGARLTDYNFGEIPPASISGYVFQDGEALISLDGQPPPNARQLRDGRLTLDDPRLARVQLELRDGVTGLPIMGETALPGTYASGPIRTVTNAQGYYEFRGLPPGVYAVYEVQPAGLVDWLDTAGTAGGIALNAQDPIDPDVLARLQVDPRSDAIVGIDLRTVTRSESNNFSELTLAQVPLPPDPLKPVPLPPPQLVPALIADAPKPLIIAVPPPPAWNLITTGGGMLDFTWHLSVIDGGTPRGRTSPISVEALVLHNAAYRPLDSWRSPALDEGQWTILASGGQNGGATVVRIARFGLRGAIPVAGDFNGDGVDEIGIYYQGRWYLDANGNRHWDENDLWAQLGDEYDLPVTGDWNGDGKDDIAIFGPAWAGDLRALEAERGLPDVHNRTLPVDKPKNVPPSDKDATDRFRLLQRSVAGQVRADVIDHVFRYGNSDHLPVAGDWQGDGIKNIGVFREGTWQLDLDGDGRLTERDVRFQYGRKGDLPVVGDFDGDGIHEVGVYRHGRWILDTNGNRQLDAHDRVFQLGAAGDLPVVGDFDGDGLDDPAVYHDGPAEYTARGQD